MTDARRLSQAISEGDGISVIVQVDRIDDVRAAEAQGAEGIALRRGIDGLPDGDDAAGALARRPRGHAAQESCDAHALIVWAERRRATARRCTTRSAEDMELVVAVSNEDDARARGRARRADLPALARRGDRDQHAIDRVIELLPDVPAGKLAIAQVDVESRDEVVALERAGFDAVLVPPGHVGELVGGAPPQV